MKRALLISGGVDPWMNQPRYLNDVVAFYRALSRRGYVKDEIRVRVGPGGFADLSGDGTLQRYGRAGVSDVLAELAWLSELSTGDSMFFMVSNHGDPDGFWTWRTELLPPSEERVTPRDLELALRASGARKVLVFGQCHAGIFGNMGLSDGVVCCACGPEEYSYPCPVDRSGASQYDEFLYHFAAALGGRYPDDSPHDQPLPPTKALTVAAAFDHAKKCDRRNGETPVLYDPHGLAVTLLL